MLRAAALALAAPASVAVPLQTIRLAIPKCPEFPSHLLTTAVPGSVVGTVVSLALLENDILFGRAETIPLLALGIHLWDLVTAVASRYP